MKFYRNRKVLLLLVLISCSVLFMVFQNMTTNSVRIEMPRIWFEHKNIPVQISNNIDASISAYLLSSSEGKPSSDDVRWKNTPPTKFSFQNACPEKKHPRTGVVLEPVPCGKRVFPWIRNTDGTIYSLPEIVVRIYPTHLPLSQSDEGTSHTISRNLFGTHFVYNNDRDEYYSAPIKNLQGRPDLENGRTFAHWTKYIDAGVARYPGGTVIKTWDWERPNGLMNCEEIDGSCIVKEKVDADECGSVNNVCEVRPEETEYMDLSEYIQYVKKSGVTPLVGINILSGLKVSGHYDSWVRKGARLAHRIRSQATAEFPRFRGAYYYLGNEDGHLVKTFYESNYKAYCESGNFTETNFALNDLCKCIQDESLLESQVLNKIDVGPRNTIIVSACNFKIFARAISKVDPNAKFILNDNHIDLKRYKGYRRVIGDQFLHGVELHSKWPYSGDTSCNSMPALRLRDWQRQHPFLVKKVDERNACPLLTKLKDEGIELNYRDHVVNNSEIERIKFQRVIKEIKNTNPNVLVMNNEYGLTQNAGIFDSEFRRFHLSLAMIEYLQELIISGYDMAALWNNIISFNSFPLRIDGVVQRDASGNRIWKSESDLSSLKLMYSKVTKVDGASTAITEMRINPASFAFEMLKDSHGKKLINLNGGAANGNGFIALDETKDKAYVYLLNKSSKSSLVKINFAIPGKIISNFFSQSLIEMGESGEGRIKEGLLGSFHQNDLVVDLPKISYTKITVGLRAIGPTLVDTSASNPSGENSFSTRVTNWCVIKKVDELGKDVDEDEELYDLDCVKKKFTDSGFEAMTYFVSAEAGPTEAGPTEAEHPSCVLESKCKYVYVKKPASCTRESKCPAVIFFHAGAWNKGSPIQFLDQAEYLSSLGIVTILPSYRTAKNGEKPLLPVKDAKSSFQWVVKNADSLGIDNYKIATAGGSAGGHLAAYVGMMVDKGRHVKAMMLLNPVIDNGPIRDHDNPTNGKGAFGYERIGDEYMLYSPYHNIRKNLPRTLVMSGSLDNKIPINTLCTFENQMKDKENIVETIVFKNAEHAFFGGKGNPSYQRTLFFMERLLGQLGWIANPRQALVLTKDYNTKIDFPVEDCAGIKINYLESVSLE